MKIVEGYGRLKMIVKLEGNGRLKIIVKLEGYGRLKIIVVMLIEHDCETRGRGGGGVR